MKNVERKIRKNKSPMLSDDYSNSRSSVGKSHVILARSNLLCFWRSILHRNPVDFCQTSFGIFRSVLIEKHWFFSQNRPGLGIKKHTVTSWNLCISWVSKRLFKWTLTVSAAGTIDLGLFYKQNRQVYRYWFIKNFLYQNCYFRHFEIFAITRHGVSLSLFYLWDNYSHCSLDKEKS
jgi:hypothetical protein